MFQVYAEGGTSNGSGLINFKKGAFYGLKAVRPMIVKYHWVTFNPAYDVIEFLPQAILHLCFLFYRVDMRVLPDFHPNAYLFRVHQDKGQQKWEIYSWAVRDAMLKAGNYKSIEVPLKEKFKYEAYMRNVPGALEPNNSYG